MYSFKNKKGEEEFILQPAYVKKLSNGRFGLCSKEEAEGIAVKGQMLKLENIKEVSDAEYQEYLAKQQEDKITELEMAVAQLSIIAAGGKAENLEGVAKAWGNLIRKGKIKAEEVPDLNGLKEEVQKRIKGDNA